MEKKEPNYKLIEDIAGECFMPLCYGGGIKTLAQAEKIFSLGVEKICIQTATLENTNLISQISEKFGSQSVIASVDVKRDQQNLPKLYASNNKKMLEKNWLSHLQDTVRAGAGEVILNAIDRDGLQQGLDLELIKQASSELTTPLIAIGGLGSTHDIHAAIAAGASAVAGSAYFVFYGPLRAVLITYSNLY